MKVLMIGDIVAKPGRIAVLERIQDIREQHEIDFTVANGENVAGGFSITPRLADELFASGIDVMTSGNHIFDKREVLPYIDDNPRLLRPANFPPGTPGKGVWTGEVRGVRIAVINLIGRIFMQPSDDPFRAVDKLLAALDADVKVRLLDFHAEATSEKGAMGWYVDGRMSAVVGTHTHVQTADERILTNGTAFLSDLGMTGSYAGVIGMKREDVIERFMTATGKRADHAEGDVRICGVVLDIDEATGRARAIERLSLTHQS
ncbi:MAG: TIGR00282 family metallophosphoesterase [Pyrinomonadaceae bacterium]